MLAVEQLSQLGVRLPSYQLGQYKVLCPQCSHTRKPHNRTDPCLRVKVDDDGAVMHCHNCGWTDHVLEALNPSPSPNPPPFRQSFSPRPLASAAPPNAPPIAWSPQPVPGEVYAMFQHRGIPMDIVDRYGIGWHPRGFVMFPYRDTAGGDVVNVKYRAAREKRFHQSKGGKKTYFGLDQIPDDDCDTLFIVEGEFDVLSVAATGLLAVSVPDGAPKQLVDNPSERDLKFQFIANTYDRVSKFKRIVIAGDNDAPGLVLREELARRYGKDRCWYVDWPEGYKDANAVLAGDPEKGLPALGANALLQALSNPVPFPIADLRSFDAYFGALDDYFDQDDHRGLLTGFTNLDELYTVRGGEVTVLTGVPGSGKSTFMNQLLVNLAAIHDAAFAVCSFELPERELGSRLAEQYIRKPFFPGYPHRMTRGELDQAKVWIREHFYLIGPEGPGGATIDGILSAARAAVARHNVRGIVIDPYTYIVKQGDNRTDFVSSLLAKVHAFAKLYDVHVWIVAHPAKQYRTKDGEFPVPDMYDISDSAAWFNYPDCGLVIHCQGDGTVAVYVKKIRFTAVGRKGVAYFRYDVSTGTYEEAFDVDESA